MTIVEKTLSHHLATINADYKVVPRLNGDLEVLVAKNLKAK